jgi:hypothetical protein
MMPHAHNDSDQLQKKKRMTAVNQFSRCLDEALALTSVGRSSGKKEIAK